MMFLFQNISAWRSVTFCLKTCLESSLECKFEVLGGVKEMNTIIYIIVLWVSVLTSNRMAVKMVSLSSSQKLCFCGAFWPYLGGKQMLQ